MIKTFILGILLGIAGVFAALHFVSAVDQEREASIISVTRNGGNTEVFHVKLPMDRGEGQHWNRAPGNLYSTPRKIRIDPSSDETIAIVLDQEIPSRSYGKAV